MYVCAIKGSLVYNTISRRLIQQLLDQGKTTTTFKRGFQLKEVSVESISSLILVFKDWSIPNAVLRWACDRSSGSCCQPGSSSSSRPSSSSSSSSSSSPGSSSSSRPGWTPWSSEGTELGQSCQFWKLKVIHSFYCCLILYCGGVGKWKGSKSEKESLILRGRVDNDTTAGCVRLPQFPEVLPQEIGSSSQWTTTKSMRGGLKLWFGQLG